MQIDVEIGADQLVLDQLPDDAGHLVAVEFDDGICNLDFGHGRGTFGLDWEAGKGGRLHISRCRGRQDGGVADYG